MFNRKNQTMLRRSPSWPAAIALIPRALAAVKTGLGTNCDQVYLQCYDGGAGNNPATWLIYP